MYIYIHFAPYTFNFPNNNTTSDDIATTTQNAYAHRSVQPTGFSVQKFVVVFLYGFVHLQH